MPITRLNKLKWKHLTFLKEPESEKKITHRILLNLPKDLAWSHRCLSTIYGMYDTVDIIHVLLTFFPPINFNILQYEITLKKNTPVYLHVFASLQLFLECIL